MKSSLLGIKGGFKNLLLLALRKQMILYGAHDVTSRCNCRCKMCPVWRFKEVREPKFETEKLIMNRIREAGVFPMAFTGGEPLLRDDVSKILKYSYDCGFFTIIITNGYFLTKKIKDFYRYVDRISVSLDSSIPSIHDSIRGIKIFDRAIRGIRAAVELGTNVVINCVISKYNLNHVENVLFLGEELGVSGITFEPVQYRFHSYSNDNLRFNAREQVLFKNKIKTLIDLKRDGHRVMNTDHYLEFLLDPEKYRDAKCERFGVTISSDAKLHILCSVHTENPGIPNTLKAGFSLKENSINDILNREDVRTYLKKMEHCRECNVSCIWEPALSFGSLRGLVSTAMEVRAHSYLYMKPKLKTMEKVITEMRQPKS